MCCHKLASSSLLFLDGKYSVPPPVDVGGTASDTYWKCERAVGCSLPGVFMCNRPSWPRLTGADIRWSWRPWWPTDGLVCPGLKSPCSLDRLRTSLNSRAFTHIFISLIPKHRKQNWAHEAVLGCMETKMAWWHNLDLYKLKPCILLSGIFKQRCLQGHKYRLVFWGLVCTFFFLERLWKQSSVLISGRNSLARKAKQHCWSSQFAHIHLLVTCGLFEAHHNVHLDMFRILHIFDKHGVENAHLRHEPADHGQSFSETRGANVHMPTNTKLRQLLMNLPPHCWSLSKPDAGRITAERREAQSQAHMHTHMYKYTDFFSGEAASLIHQPLTGFSWAS